MEEVIEIRDMKSKSITDLHEMAEKLNLQNFAGLRKQDLIFLIEQNMLDNNYVLRGEGVLEILPEGYGFLRSPDYNYLPGPDDIYVSPSQIKRFDLRTGDTVSRSDPAAQGRRTLSRPAQGGGGQLRGSRRSQAQDPFRQPHPAVSPTSI